MKSEETPLEQIERSLDDLEAYSEVWVLEHLRMGHATTAEDMMLWKERDGRSMLVELLKIRSTLLLARALERQNENTKPATTPEQFLQAAKEALVKTGYFKPEEVGDDIAPRILEMWFNKEDQRES